MILVVNQNNLWGEWKGKVSNDGQCQGGRELWTLHPRYSSHLAARRWGGPWSKRHPGSQVAGSQSSDAALPPGKVRPHRMEIGGDKRPRPIPSGGSLRSQKGCLDRGIETNSNDGCVARARRFLVKGEKFIRQCANNPSRVAPDNRLL